MDSLRYRMIAIDLDGTLLSPAGLVTKRTKDAIHSTLASGILVCFATGRNFPESQKVLDAVAHYDSAVFVGGAMIVDTKQRVILHRTLMGGDLARELCQFLEAHGHAVLAFQDNSTTGVDYLISAHAEINEATRHWMSVTASKVERASDLQSRSHEHTIRVGMVAKKEEIAAMLPDMEKQFGSRIMYHSLRASAYAVEVLEVFDPAVNKWEGIMHVARRHGIEPQEIIAVGDDVNDIVMIKNAGLGVAMGNAQPEIKAVAKKIIGHHGDDGLAEFLEELISDRAAGPMDLE